MMCSRRGSRRVDSQLIAGNYNFTVKELIYFGSAATNNNKVNLEIIRRITRANRCYIGLSRKMNSKALSQRTKKTLYNELILPMLLYDAKAWTETQSTVLFALEVSTASGGTTSCRAVQP